MTAPLCYCERCARLVEVRIDRWIVDGVEYVDYLCSRCGLVL